MFGRAGPTARPAGRFRPGGASPRAHRPHRLRNGLRFIETVDGREIYFHRNSVLNGDFLSLREGDRVRFHEEPGDKGPKASTVHLEK